MRQYKLHRIPGIWTHVLLKVKQVCYQLSRYSMTFTILVKFVNVFDQDKKTFNFVIWSVETLIRSLSGEARSLITFSRPPRFAWKLFYFFLQLFLSFSVFILSFSLKKFKHFSSFFDITFSNLFSFPFLNYRWSEMWGREMTNV